MSNGFLVNDTAAEAAIGDLRKALYTDNLPVNWDERVANMLLYCDKRIKELELKIEKLEE